MKKTAKKLVLAKETLRRLEPAQLGALAGATLEEPAVGVGVITNFDDCLGRTRWYECWGTYTCPTRSC